MAVAAGGLLFSCLARSRGWYEEHGLDGNAEAGAFGAAFPGRALAGFLANGEVFGETQGRGEEKEEVEFMHGFTAVHAISSSIRRVCQP